MYTYNHTQKHVFLFGVNVLICCFLAIDKFVQEHAVRIITHKNMYSIDPALSSHAPIYLARDC